MSQATRNLWPDSISVDAVVPPVVILREQAALLGARTKGLVRAEVESTQRPVTKIDDYLQDVLPPEARVVHSHTLYLVAPALDNYRYSLLDVMHDFQPYPCEVTFYPALGREFLRVGSRTHLSASMIVVDENDFVEWLDCALNQGETIRVINALISRVQHLGKSNA